MDEQFDENAPDLRNLSDLMSNKINPEATEKKDDSQSVSSQGVTVTQVVLSVVILLAVLVAVYFFLQKKPAPTYLPNPAVMSPGSMPFNPASDNNSIKK